MGRWNAGRDLTAAVFLLIALFLPWSLSTGAGVPGGHGRPFFVIVGVSLASATSLVLTFALRRRPDAAAVDRLRLWLNVPYSLTVLAFAAMATATTVRFSGTWNAPAGVGPGAWFGIAGAVLAGQPCMTATAADVYRFSGWRAAARIAGRGALGLAALSTVFSLYWRARQVIGAGHGLVVDVTLIAGTVIYAAAIMMVVVLGCRWIQQDDGAARLALSALGAAVLSSGVLVWCTRLGRDVDAFHGIAQNTSAAAVGFEAYLVWIVAAAIVAPVTMHSLVTANFAATVWPRAAGMVLVMIAAWSIGTCAARIVDLVSVMVFDLRDPPWTIVVTGTVSAACAWVALRLRVLLYRRRRRNHCFAAAIALAALMVTRLILNVALAPRIPAAQSADVTSHPVYGTTITHQLTSTFDVVACLLAVFVASAAFIRPAASSRGQGPQRQTFLEPTPPPAATPPKLATGRGPAGPRISRSANARINRPSSPSAGDGDQRPVWSTSARKESRSAVVPGAPTGEAPTAPGQEQDLAVTGADDGAAIRPLEAATLLSESSKRFGAGTTYG